MHEYLKISQTYLYYTNKHESFKMKQTNEHYESTIDHCPKKQRGVTMNDIQKLIQNCKKGNSQLVKEDVLKQLGMNRKGK